MYLISVIAGTDCWIQFEIYMQNIVAFIYIYL